MSSGKYTPTVSKAASANGHMTMQNDNVMLVPLEKKTDDAVAQVSNGIFASYVHYFRTKQNSLQWFLLSVGARHLSATKSNEMKIK